MFIYLVLNMFPVTWVSVRNCKQSVKTRRKHFGLLNKGALKNQCKMFRILNKIRYRCKEESMVYFLLGYSEFEIVI